MGAWVQCGRVGGIRAVWPMAHLVLSGVRPPATCKLHSPGIEHEKNSIAVLVLDAAR